MSIETDFENLFSEPQTNLSQVKTPENSTPDECKENICEETPCENLSETKCEENEEEETECEENKEEENKEETDAFKYIIYVDSYIVGCMDTEQDAQEKIYNIAKKLKGLSYMRDTYRNLCITTDDAKPNYVELIGCYAWSPIRIFTSIYHICYHPIKYLKK